MQDKDAAYLAWIGDSISGRGAVTRHGAKERCYAERRERTPECLVYCRRRVLCSVNCTMTRLTIITDLDGTLLPRPFGTVGASAHPNLSTGPAYAPLVALLNAGATVIGVTGSTLATHKVRFYDELPLEHRRAGRVLLAVQTGSTLYRGSAADGEPLVDTEFTAYLAKHVAIRLTDAVVTALIDEGRAGIRRFFADLECNPSLVDPSGSLAYLLDCSANEIPVTTDGKRVPRIEVREGNSAVVFVGVPSSLGARYFKVPSAVAGAVDGRPTGRVCFDCVPRGLNKSIVVRYLLASGLVSSGVAFALGDQPLGNDEGLTRWHRNAEHDIPFVSVSERVDMVQEWLRECWITSCSNDSASAVLFSALAQYLTKDGALVQQLTTDVLSDIVHRLNEETPQPSPRHNGSEQTDSHNEVTALDQSQSIK